MSPKLLLVGSETALARAAPLIEQGDLHAGHVVGVITSGKRAPSSNVQARLAKLGPVLGPIAEFNRIIVELEQAKNAPDVLLIVDDSVRLAELPGEPLRRLKAGGARFLRLPRLQELTEREAVSGAARTRQLSLEELLSRPPVRLDLERIQALVRGKQVLVTGAGGSIGSEICRQIAALGCRGLTLVDNGERALFEIDRELGSDYPSLDRAARLCDVRDAARVGRVFAEAQPDLVFHAAALKHVPLLEYHVCEGVLTNVIGTLNVAEACRTHKVGQMVLLSTDKAVSPSSIMGATKRVAEGVVRGLAEGGVRYCVTRFGNVLGSAGSVAPIFRSQIEAGGPVTITHPDVERFFMTLPEAVHLVLHAAAVSSAGSADWARVFVLDMGEPIKIIDLARRMISLSGKRPEIDIPILITGLRPGEKLTEELVDVDEEAHHCAPGVLEVRDRHAAFRISRQTVLELERLARADEAEVLAARLKSLAQPTAAPAQVLPA